MGQALYRKYRSKSLDEIVGQEHITATLKNALKSGRISHAYLFTGPRGVGKTSIARILAHEINGLPYTDESTHLDIIEIDAASNRRIDEIRELRDKVHIAPTSAKYKVYIIDEVHMLTREAFNALLKTLEEPPSHVVFILATTEVYKLPETIVSRTQRFTFKPVETKKVVEHLAQIAKQEKITIEKPALELIAEHGEGSFRDSISMLDQASGYGDKITEESVRTMLGIAPDEALQTILADIASGNASQLLQTLSELYSRGFQAGSLASQLSQLLRQQLVDGGATLGHAHLLNLMKALLEVPAAHNPERCLEITLLEHMPAPAATITQAAQVVATPPPAPKPAGPPKASAKTKAEEVVVKTPEPALEPEPAPKKPAVLAVAVIDEAVWPQVLDTIRKTHNTLYGILRMAQPVFDNDGLELQFNFAFHQKRMSEVKNKKIVADIIESLTGQPVAIRCVVVTKPAAASAPAEPLPSVPTSLPEAAPADEAFTTISNIFGGGELLES